MADDFAFRSFDDDARLATASHRPAPRGIAFEYAPSDGSPATTDAARHAVRDRLPGWRVEPVEGLKGWHTATPPTDPATGAPIALGKFWERLRDLGNEPGVTEVEPLLLVAGHQPEDEAGAPFAMGFGPEQFGLWGWPYDSDTKRAIENGGKKHDWHLRQMNVPAAWEYWKKEHPGREPGDGILIGHPDTGYTDHDEVVAHLSPRGKSFLREEQGGPNRDGRDDLRRTGARVHQQPGHGTGTASVIVSGAPGRAFGVAPGAMVLPLRVSRSVIHVDFETVGEAILYAVAQGADVISMSLGGPLKMGFVHRCIQQARQNGVIVVSAAGNMIPSTVFPAAFPEVIAAAATHPGNAPWRYSGLGPYVDIAAPGEAVWRALSELKEGTARFDVTQGTGTSFATACVAGLAALWLSYNGGRRKIAHDKYGGDLSLVPLAFQYLLAKTADKKPEFVRNGRHGAGIADAFKLLDTPLPDRPEIERFGEVIRKQKARHTTFLGGLLSGWRGIVDQSAVSLSIAATVDENGAVRTDPVDESEVVRRAEEDRADETRLLQRLLGPEVDALEDELLARVAADAVLLTGFHRLRPAESLLPLFDRLLGQGDDAGLSAGLRARLTAQREEEARRTKPLHSGKLVPGVALTVPDAGLDAPPTPAYRQLRAYSFDPSLATRLETAPIDQVTIPTRWEEVRPGPIGEYLEIIDIDPASGCVYSPVDLNHPFILGQQGLAPSEGNPQFHQQMVYAVAMNTIHQFELALGRPIFWSPLRPWLSDSSGEAARYTPEAHVLLKKQLTAGKPERNVMRRDRYVQRLRIYPHALREANAYYSPAKRALLFGYFPATDDDTGRHYPGGMVFTCLSHDIIAHEMTHALLDGMHPYFNEPTNEDVWAFHEAFADIMALFQHFTYPEVLRRQIAATRGDLEAENMLGELAQQFGQATGGHGALRSALGKPDEHGKWQRLKPNPRALRDARSHHARGSILVAAVFDAFIAIYNDRVADLLRIATDGSGELRPGNIHPDLVNRLADEASQVAEDVLHTCIRAMDYVPPVDITFGEFLRALITADYDLSPRDRRANRVAFIDAFRSWGIYPRDVTTLSEDSLRWRPPAADAHLQNLSTLGTQMNSLVSALDQWEPGRERAQIFLDILEAQSALHELLRKAQAGLPAGQALLPGFDLRGAAGFRVGNMRPARRVGQHGEFRTEMVVEIVQQLPRRSRAERGAVPFRGGCTLIVDMQTMDVRYVIYKRLYESLPTRGGGRDGVPVARYHRQQRFERRQRAGGAGVAQALWQGEDDSSLADWLVDTYAPATSERRAWHEPFALMHRVVE